MVYLDPSFAVIEIAKIAAMLDARIVQDDDKNFAIVPNRTAAERHTNTNIMRMPRRKRQIVGADLPNGPEVTA